MITPEDRLTIELPFREALAVYRRRFFLIIGIGVANLVVLVLVLLFGLTALGAAAASAVAGLAAGVLVALAAILGGFAMFLLKHWLLVLVVIVAMFLLGGALDGTRGR